MITKNTLRNSKMIQIYISDHGIYFDMLAQHVLVRCPVCNGSGAVQSKNSAGRHSIPFRSEEKCDCCDGRGWTTKAQMDGLFCAGGRRQ